MQTHIAQIHLSKHCHKFSSVTAAAAAIFDKNYLHHMVPDSSARHNFFAPRRVYTYCIVEPSTK